MNSLESSKFQSLELFYASQSLLNHSSGESWVTKFEQLFSQRFSVNHAIAVNSGTSGLHAALYAAGVGPGDEVLLPALTVVMDAFVIIQLGAIPVFVDVSLDTHLINVEDLVSKISQRSKVILTVSWEGLPCDMDPIRSIAQQNNLIVVDDSARSVLSTYKGHVTGTYADITVFSFEAKKHLTCGGEGGMIVTNNPELATRARKFAGIGYKHLTADSGVTHLAIDDVQSPTYKRFDTIGYNYRMNDISAAVGIGQLSRVDQIVNNRISCANIFLEVISDYDFMIPQYTPSDRTHSYYTLSVMYSPNPSHHMPSWREFYKQYKSIGADGFYGVVSVPYQEPALSGYLFNGKNSNVSLCPVAEHLQSNVMCFKTNYRELDQAHCQARLLSGYLSKL